MKIGFDVSQTGGMRAGCGYVAFSLIRTLAAGASQFLRKVFPKKLHYRLDALFASDFGDVLSRLDSKAGHAGGLKVFQEIAIIAGDFNNQALLIQSKFLNVPFGSLFRMAQHQI